MSDPTALDTGHAHPARIYNYWLGGKDNCVADREAPGQAIAASPGIVADVIANRAFLTRVARFLAGDRGVRQFLDIGTGLPAAGNTHEVAQAAAPDSRIGHVGNDPIVFVAGLPSAGGSLGAALPRRHHTSHQPHQFSTDLADANSSSVRVGFPAGMFLLWRPNR